MRTNLEKWNFYMNDLSIKVNEFMDTINNKIPDVFWLIRGVRITECKILNRHYSVGVYYSGNNPTRKDVEQIKILHSQGIKFNENKAYFDYSYRWGDDDKYGAKSAIKIIDLFNSKGAFLNKQEAIKESEKQNKKYLARKEFQELHKKDKNYNYHENGYKFLGWQNGWKHVYFDEDNNLCSESGKPHRTFGYLTKDHPEYGKCKDLKHQKIEISHNQRGSENDVSCPVCKIYWKYDCSD